MRGGTQGLKATLAAVLMLFAGRQSLHAGGATQKITVRVYNYAQVPRGKLARAEKEASAIFEQAGVEIEWLNCPVSSAEVPPGSACSQAVAPTQAVLRVYARFKAVSSSFRETTTGFALLPTTFGNASYASVFYDRVEELAKFGIASTSQILAPCVAHEIGHLLLDAGGHSPTGIMRARWGAEDLRAAATGGLLFTPDQAQKIGAAVRERVEQESAAGLSPITDISR